MFPVTHFFKLRSYFRILFAYREWFALDNFYLESAVMFRINKINLKNKSSDYLHVFIWFLGIIFCRCSLKDLRLVFLWFLYKFYGPCTKSIFTKWCFNTVRRIFKTSVNLNKVTKIILIEEITQARLIMFSIKMTFQWNIFIITVSIKSYINTIKKTLATLCKWVVSTKIFNFKF